MTFSVSGTVTFKIDANFAVASYLSTSISNSGGKPTGDIVAEVENSGSSYTLSASVSAGTTYYFFFRGNNGRQFIGKVGINLTAPVLATYYVKVSYNANGGSGAPSAQTGNDTDNQVPITISSTKPTRSDYVFLGWAVSSSASSAKYSSGKTYDF